MTTVPVRDSIARVDAEVAACARCPELRAYCAEIARVKKREHRDATYHGAPVPRFGDPAARVVLVGLAPGAHGSNRTGRPFTGDGLVLHDAFITTSVRCAPPANKPTPTQRANCVGYLERELALLANARVIVTLGKLADDTVHRILRTRAALVGERAPFAHGAETTYALDGRRVTVLASYHPSRQNTNTGVLTEPMLDAIFTRASILRSVV